MIYIIISVIVAVGLIFLAWIWGGYNTLQRGKQNVLTMFSNIKTEYQRRADLFYNLAEAVKSYAKFEKDTLTQVISMRNGNFGKNNLDAMQKMKGMEGILSKLMLVVERYPQLRATEEYKRLMKETRITEDRINIARTEYNDTVRDYNLYILSFPSNILAGIFNFKKEIYFENDEDSNRPYKMDLKLK